MSETDVDLALWGKWRGLPSPYLLACHLLDTAAAAEALWDGYLPPGLRTTVAAELGCSMWDITSFASTPVANRTVAPAAWSQTGPGQLAFSYGD